MKEKLIILLAAVSLVFSLAGLASAAPVSYTDYQGFGIFGYKITNGASKLWQHNILDEGFNPTIDTLYSASLDLFLSDDMGPWYDPLDWFYAFEYADLQAGGQTYNIGEIDLGSYSVALTAFVQLQEAGLLDVTLTGTGGDFILWSSTLEASGVRNEGEPIPEPATMLLLGSGLIGLAGLRRKLRKE